MTHLWLGQSSHLTCNIRHPCKDEVSGLICTSSLPVSSDLSEFQIQILVFILVKLLSFKFHGSYFTWADLPAEPHPAQCPQRLSAHALALQGSFLLFPTFLQVAVPLVSQAGCLKTSHPLRCHSCWDIQTGKISFPKQLSLTSTAATKGYKLLFLTYKFSRSNWIQHNRNKLTFLVLM